MVSGIGTTRAVLRQIVKLNSVHPASLADQKLQAFTPFHREREREWVSLGLNSYCTNYSRLTELATKHENKFELCIYLLVG